MSISLSHTRLQDSAVLQPGTPGHQEASTQLPSPNAVALPTDLALIPATRDARDAEFKKLFTLNLLVPPPP